MIGDAVLRAIAKELTYTIRKNVTIDWTQRESARARLRTMVKRLLRKPPPPIKEDPPPMSRSIHRILVASVAHVLCLLSPAAHAMADAPRDLAGYVLLGVHGVELGDRSFVAGGNVGVNAPAGVLLVDQSVFMADGSAVVADQVSVGENSSVFDVFANSLDDSLGPIVVRGGGPTAFAPAIVTLPPLPSFAPGTAPVLVPDGGSVALPAGAYGDVTVGGLRLKRSGVRITLGALLGSVSDSNGQGLPRRRSCREPVPARRRPRRSRSYGRCEIRRPARGSWRDSRSACCDR